jgi:hypothetical protein
MDTFLRSYMDEAGYVPLAVVCAYPNVAYFNVPVDALMAALTQACAQADSPLELDLAVGTIKLKNKWDPDLFSCTLKKTVSTTYKSVNICSVQTVLLELAQQAVDL